MEAQAREMQARHRAADLAAIAARADTGDTMIEKPHIDDQIIRWIGFNELRPAGDAATTTGDPPLPWVLADVPPEGSGRLHQRVMQRRLILNSFDPDQTFYKQGVSIRRGEQRLKMDLHNERTITTRYTDQFDERKIVEVPVHTSLRTIRTLAPEAAVLWIASMWAGGGWQLWSAITVERGDIRVVMERQER